MNTPPIINLSKTQQEELARRMDILKNPPPMFAMNHAREMENYKAIVRALKQLGLCPLGHVLGDM